MKRINYSATIFALSMLLSSIVMGNEYNNGFGVAKYNMEVSDDEQLSGYSLSYRRILADIAMLKIDCYKMDHDLRANSEAKGYNINLIASSNFNSGFTFHLGLGYFSETWDVRGTTNTDFSLNGISKPSARAWRSTSKEAQIVGKNKFSGVQLILGAGFSVKRMDLSYFFTIRNNGPYKELFGSNLPGLELIPFTQEIELSLKF